MLDIPFTKVLLALLVIVGWAVAGMLVRFFGLLKEEWDGKLLRLVIWCFYPCLILRNVMENQAIAEQPSLLVQVLLFGFAALALGQVVASITARWVPFANRRQRNTFIFTTGIFNYGYFAFPIAESLFKEDTFGILLIFVVGVEAAIWSVGVLFLTAGSEKLALKRLLNPPVLAVILAVTLNWSGAAANLPEQTSSLIGGIGKLAIPFGLILIGATLFDNLKALDLRKHLRLVGVACLTRQFLLPLFFILAAVKLPMPLELKAVLVVEAAMPCGIFPIVIAKHYNGSPNTALQIILSTTFLSGLMIPIWVLAGVYFADLQPLLNIAKP